jgi:hypothetical protein
MLGTRRALVVIVGAIVVLSWALPTYGASTFKLAVKALGRANTAVHDSALAVSTSKSANTTANTANSTANAAKSTANSAQSTANTANSTANTALSIANGSAHVVANTTHSFDAGSISAGTCASDTFSQLGVASTDSVILTPPSTLPDGISGYASTSTGQLNLSLCNYSGSTINPPSITYRFMVLR